MIRNPERHHDLWLRLFIHGSLKPPHRAWLRCQPSDPLRRPRPPPAPLPHPVPDVLAAVDLGSNSFHMVVARYSHGQLVIIDRLREMVRLAAGVAENGRIDKDVAARALACLERFGQRLRDMHADSVRVRGHQCAARSRTASRPFSSAPARRSDTRSKSSPAWKRRASSTRASRTPCPASRASAWWSTSAAAAPSWSSARASTPLELESLQMGCVSLSERFFRDGKISAKRFERARLAARLELEPVQAAFRRRGWEHSAGSSGTVRAIGEAIRALDPQARTITPEGMNRAIEYCVDAGHTRELAARADHRGSPPGIPRRGWRSSRKCSQCWG